MGYVLTEKCDGIVRCSCYILELNHGINSKWQFLSCAAIALHSVSDNITQFTCTWWHRLIKGKGYPMTSLYRYRGDVEVCPQLLCNLGARRGWVVNTTLWLPYPPEKTWFPLYRRLSGPCGWSGQERKVSA